MRAGFLKRFKDDESGIATIESLLWMPLFFYLFVLITDVSLIFYGKAQALRILQDGNRALSVRFFTTREIAQEDIKTRLREFAPTADPLVTVTGGMIITTVDLKASELMAVGSIPTFQNTEIRVTAQHFLEQ